MEALLHPATPRGQARPTPTQRNQATTNQGT